MIVVITLAFELLRLPFRILGWALCKLAGAPPDDMAALQAAVHRLDNDPTANRIRRRSQYD